jgi:dTDP-glucose 4,6-dehydratase
MRVLIAGAAGFLGSHLCWRLLREGFEVIGVDNFLTGQQENIAALLGQPHFTFLHYDVCNFMHVDGPLDAVLHLASPASPQDYLKFPIETLKAGALGTHKLLGLALAKQAIFLLASTSEVYGDPLVNPQPETYFGNVDTISPRGVYDEAKRFAEALTTAYFTYHGLDTRIVRIFNTYGPHMRPHDGRVVSNFFMQAIQRQPLTIYGDGSQTRSLCYVDDLVRGLALVLLAEADAEDQGRDIHYPINLGSTHEVSVLEIAQTIMALINDPSLSLEFLPLPQGDPQVRRPDITRAQNLLGWLPVVPTAMGLTLTMQYFQAKYDKTVVSV